MKRLALIAIASGLLAAGCSGSAEPGAAPVTTIGPQSVAASPARTQAARTSRVALSFETISASGKVDMASVGVLDFGKREADLTETYTFPGGAKTTDRKILASGYSYFSSTAHPRFLRRNATSAAGGLSFPGSSLEKLAGVSGAIATVGIETVRGARTTHFRGTIDEAKYLAKASAETRAAIKRAGSTLVPLSQPFDAWIDDQGRLRRLSQHLTANNGDKIAETTEYYDFGVTVAIKAPRDYNKDKS
ncbi:MAG: lipoprotein [Frankiales bacterium]|nr:lipoprotein [Frankiales bacterium]